MFRTVRQLDAMNRERQVNWLQDEAAEIADIAATANEVVASWEEGFEINGEPLPSWYDEHDRMLMERFVEQSRERDALWIAQRAQELEAMSY